MPIESSRLFSLLIYSRCSIHRRGLTHFLVLIRWWWIGHRFTNSHHDIARLPQRVLGPESVCKAHLGPQHRFIVAITSSLWKNAISRHRSCLVFASPCLCLAFAFTFVFLVASPSPLPLPLPLPRLHLPLPSIINHHQPNQQTIQSPITANHQSITDHQHSPSMRPCNQTSTNINASMQSSIITNRNTNQSIIQSIHVHRNYTHTYIYIYIFMFRYILIRRVVSYRARTVELIQS